MRLRQRVGRIVNPQALEKVFYGLPDYKSGPAFPNYSNDSNDISGPTGSPALTGNSSDSNDISGPTGMILLDRHRRVLSLANRRIAQ